MRPAKILISLHVRAGWSKFSLDAYWIGKNAKILHADNEDFDQIVQMRRLIWVFVQLSYQKVRFLTLRLICVPFHLIFLLLYVDIVSTMQKKN